MVISANLKGHTALITGAAGLMGLEHSKALVGANCNLIITDINKEALDITASKLKDYKENSSVKVFKMDVTSEDSIYQVNKELINRGIYVDILINNAAINPKVEKNKNNKELTRLENFSLGEWNKELQVGLTGAFLCSKVFGSSMFLNGIKGNIINISSDLSVISPLQSLYTKKNLKQNEQPVKPITYSVIKTGLIGLTRYLATYWEGSGIRCNALSPGGIFDNQPDEFVKKLSDQIPLGRMANLDEYHAAILFLCSPSSSYMNGHNLVLDGGRSIW